MMPSCTWPTQNCRLVEWESQAWGATMAIELTAFTHEKAVLRKYAFIDKLPVLAQLLDARFPAYTGFKKFAVNLFGKRFTMKAVNSLTFPYKAVRTFLIQLFCAWVALRLTGRRLVIKN